MCHAIIRIKYFAEKTPQLVEVNSESELKTKIAELCEKDQVIAVSVFPRSHDVVLTKRWETKPYYPPAEPPIAA